MQERYYGKYRGKVVNNIDPQRLGRLQVIVPDLTGPTPIGWAMPCVPYAGPKVGMLALPPIGANVWVEFEAGKLDSPIWTGGFWSQMEVLTEAIGPNVKIIKTETGKIKIDDLQMSFELEMLTAAGPVSLTINPQGISMKVGVTEMTLTPQGINSKQGAASINIAPQAIDIVQGSAKISVTPASISIQNGAGTITVSPASVNINNGALEVI